MGFGVSTSTNVSTSKAVSNLVQDVSSQCIGGSISQQQSGNVYNFDNSHLGTVSITQRATVKLSCIIEHSIQSLAKQLMTQHNTAHAKNASAILSVNVDTATTISHQTMVNNITQKLNSTCKGGAIKQSQDNITVNVKNSVIQNFNMGQIANSDTKCKLTTLAKANAALKGQQVSDAKTGGGTIQTLIIAAAIVIILIVAGVIGFKLMGSQGKDGKGGGLSPDVLMKTVEKNPELLLA